MLMIDGTEVARAFLADSRDEWDIVDDCPNLKPAGDKFTVYINAEGATVAGDGIEPAPWPECLPQSWQFEFDATRDRFLLASLAKVFKPKGQPKWALRGGIIADGKHLANVILLIAADGRAIPGERGAYMIAPFDLRVMLAPKTLWLMLVPALLALTRYNSGGDMTEVRYKRDRFAVLK